MTAIALVALLAQIPLPDGPGKEEALRLCKGCHEVERSFSVRKDRAGWEETMAKMSTLGLKGKPEELASILEYLVKHFPAEELPRLNINQAKAIEFESRLSLPRTQAAAIVGFRTRNGPFRSIDDLKKVPGVDAAKIEARRDRLTVN